MHHTKLILFAVVLAIVAVFGAVFWSNLKHNQQELSNTPLPVTTESDNAMPESSGADSEPGLTPTDSVEDIEEDLEQTSLELDADLAELEAELQEL